MPAEAACVRLRQAGVEKGGSDASFPSGADARPVGVRGVVGVGAGGHRAEAVLVCERGDGVQHLGLAEVAAVGTVGPVAVASQLGGARREMGDPQSVGEVAGAGELAVGQALRHGGDGQDPLGSEPAYRRGEDQSRVGAARVCDGEGATERTNTVQYRRSRMSSLGTVFLLHHRRRSSSAQTKCARGDGAQGQTQRRRCGHHVVVLGLGRVRTVLDPYGVSVDFDGLEGARQRCAGCADMPDAEGAVLGQDQVTQLSLVTWCGEDVQDMSGSALLHHSGGRPGVGGAGVQRARDDVPEKFAGDVVEVGLQDDDVLVPYGGEGGTDLDLEP